MSTRPPSQKHIEQRIKHYRNRSNPTIKGRKTLVDASKRLLLFSGATLFGLPEMNMHILCKNINNKLYVFIKRKNYLRVIPNVIRRKR